MIAPVASFARERVVRWVSAEQVDRDDLSSQLAGAASAVAAWGLLQAVVFWEGSGRDEHRRLLAALKDWMVDERNLRQRPVTGTLDGFLLDLTHADYRQLTGEAIELFVFLKRFARVAKSDATWPG